MQFTVSSSKDVSYDINLTYDLFSNLNPSLATAIKSTSSKRSLVVIDSKVEVIWGSIIDAYLKHHDIEYEKLIIDAGEHSKNFNSVFSIVDAIIDFGLNRRKDQVVAIGGGVVLDLVGLATSLYRRGASCIKVPTTLMGIVDAGIGVKTGVNFNYHKNRLGTYSAPSSVLLDPKFVTTQDKRHIANGIAEIIKMALIGNIDLFNRLESEAEKLSADKFNGNQYTDILCTAIEDMINQLEPNLWEKELNRTVDYGHTFSPTLELHTKPELLHGEAVSIDMAFSLTLAYCRGLLQETDYIRSISLIKSYGLPLICNLCKRDTLWSALEDSVLHRDGLQRIPLTDGIGAAVFINDVTVDEIEHAVNVLKSTISRIGSKSSQLEYS